MSTSTRRKERGALAQEVREHYEARGFSKNAIKMLLTSIGSGWDTQGKLVLAGTGLKRDVSQLLGRFPPANQNPAGPEELKTAAAIFAFSFGYRLKAGQGTGSEARLPGTNNRKLADIVAELRARLTGIPTCVQFEIADSLEERDPPVEPDYRTPAQDIGTKQVLDLFTRWLGWKALVERQGRVIVVAHTHHVGRCTMLAKDAGLSPLLPPQEYAGYDPFEQQARVKNEVEFIHSDFVSMVASCP